MMQNMFFFLLIINNFLFNLFKAPLMLMIVLFVKTITICLLMGMLSKSFWFSYILFLVFIGGILILFSYIISLLKNEKLNNKMNYFYKLMFLLLFFFFFWILLNVNINNLDLNLSFNQMNNNLNLNKLFNFPTNLINMLLMAYLFFMLIIVTKITNNFMGPLRIK